MTLLSLHGVDHGVGGPPLLEGVDLAVDTGERIALVGRNGAGKSTLLRLMAGALVPDDGEVRRSDGLRLARLAQEVPTDLSGSVYDVVAAGLGDLGGLVAEYHRLAHAQPVDLDALAAVQAKLEAADGWTLEARVAEVLTRTGLDGDARVESLSGGMKRRVLFARALAADPQLLLLDEPTNHLDIEAIDWLEGLLRGFSGSIVFVTHDRRFLRALATRIVEIDRGRVTSWPGDWDNYLRRSEERAHAEAEANARFDKLLAQEEAWIRQGIKARRTRDEGRVRRLQRMRGEAAQRRQRTGQVRMGTASAEASGRRVIEARDLCFAHGDTVLVRDFSTRIMRGDRIGLIGPNGSGKSTLLRLLLGQLQPQGGEVVQGSGVEIAYFDQHRAALREDWNALDNVSEGRESVEVGGQRKHVLGYLQDFLFTAERARAPITRLSGGERNRLLLAKLFARPSNLLVMDEPTNDLDVETLELLEELLVDYPGTLLVVSHDRDFLDNVVTSVLVMEGEGRVGEYVGGYSDWVAQRRPPVPPAAPARSQAPTKVPAQPGAPAQPPAPRARKLGYREQQELEGLPARIEVLEGRVESMTAAMGDPAFFQREAAAITADQQALAAVQSELEAAYARWEALESAAAQATSSTTR